MLSNIILSLILIAMVVLAIRKLIRDKQSGVTCAGCPQAKQCPSQANASPFITVKPTCGPSRQDR